MEDELKTCTLCLESLPVTNFGYKFKAKGKRHARCKKCLKEYKDEHYKKNRVGYIIKARKYYDVVVLPVVKNFILEALSCGCCDCGEKDIRCLDFDHMDRGSKKLAVSKMMGNRYSLKAIQAEIRKCEVRCANCHRIKTSDEGGWWRSKIA